MHALETLKGNEMLKKDLSDRLEDLKFNSGEIDFVVTTSLKTASTTPSNRIQLNFPPVAVVLSSDRKKLCVVDGSDMGAIKVFDSPDFTLFKETTLNFKPERAAISSDGVTLCVIGKNNLKKVSAFAAYNISTGDLKTFGSEKEDFLPYFFTTGKF